MPRDNLFSQQGQQEVQTLNAADASVPVCELWIVGWEQLRTATHRFCCPSLDKEVPTLVHVDGKRRTGDPAWGRRFWHDQYRQRRWYRRDEALHFRQWPARRVS